MSQIQFVELHQSNTAHCKLDPTLVAHLENGTLVVLEGLTAEQVETATYEDAMAMVVAAKQLPWEPSGRCCSSFQKDVWTRRL